ncbi:hypothetical protein ND748_10095 [Frankia sp. AiPs1]|uniref:hypothetical protein n=1 Tax=Frankia sp. AiPs1 TaxID=573493 RepID=UPI002044613C|nr:hypothetical protein [Frankia sp. AiPs1]MCM3922009.1 hypothetical protein [Frankia sp. AiPs1]
MCRVRLRSGQPDAAFTWRRRRAGEAADFRFAAARARFDLGRLPTTISTDLDLFNTAGPVWSPPETMSKIWMLGRPRRSPTRGG